MLKINKFVYKKILDEINETFQNQLKFLYDVLFKYLIQQTYFLLDKDENIIFEENKIRKNKEINENPIIKEFVIEKFLKYIDDENLSNGFIYSNDLFKELEKIDYSEKRFVLLRLQKTKTKIIKKYLDFGLFKYINKWLKEYNDISVEMCLLILTTIENFPIDKEMIQRQSDRIDKSINFVIKNAMNEEVKALARRVKKRWKEILYDDNIKPPINNTNQNVSSSNSSKSPVIKPQNIVLSSKPKNAIINKELPKIVSYKPKQIESVTISSLQNKLSNSSNIIDNSTGIKRKNEDEGNKTIKQSKVVNNDIFGNILNKTQAKKEVKVQEPKILPIPPSPILPKLVMPIFEEKKKVLIIYYRHLNMFLGKVIQNYVNFIHQKMEKI